MDKNSNKKKVLFLITKSNWGGAQRYVFDLATNLDPDIFDVAVALGEGGELGPRLEQAGVRVIAIPGLVRDISFSKELRASATIAKIIKKEKPDVLHINSSKAGVIGTLLGRILRVPRILFTAHGWAFNEDRSHIQKNVFKALHWMTVLLSHHTIAVSNTIKEQMNWPFVEQKISVINPGRSITDLKPQSEARGILETKIIDSDANLSGYHKDIWVGTIAELHPIKRLNRAIDSIASLSRTMPNIRYIIIGDGELRVALQQQVHDLGIEQHIFFTGSVHEAARFLPAFDLFVLPSASEAYGYVLLEAGIAHVPVVATDVGGVTDIITDLEDGLLVPPDDTPALTRAIQTLLSDKEIRTRLADSLHQNVQNRTAETMTAQTILRYSR